MTRNDEYLGGELLYFRKAKNWKRYLRTQLSRYISGDVLEVGAGIGSTTEALWSDRISTWTCLEPSAELIAPLRRNTASLADGSGSPPAIRNMKLDTLDRSPIFDCVLYIDVLEHIQDDQGELGRAVDVLRPAGRMITLSPAHNWLYSEFDKQVGHFRRYDRAGLSALTPSGVRLVCLRYLDSVGVVASLANRLLIRRNLPTMGQVKCWDRVLVPVSRLLDPVLSYTLGKSVLCIWQRT